MGCLVGLLLATAGGIVGPVDGAAAAGAHEVARPPDVTVVGDSLAVRAEDQLRAVFRHRRPMNVLAITDGAYVDWVRRRWLDTILRDPPSILVVALGHGDGTHSTPPDVFASQVRALLAAVVPHVDCVRWLDVRERWTYYRNVNRRAAAYNRMLRREAARFGKVEVVRYSAWADQADDSFFERDRLHPSPTGRWVFARMVRQAADGCDPNLRTGPYWDVLDHEAHAPAVRWLHQNEILREDHGNGTFATRDWATCPSPSPGATWPAGCGVGRASRAVRHLPRGPTWPRPSDPQPVGWPTRGSSKGWPTARSAPSGPSAGASSCGPSGCWPTPLPPERPPLGPTSRPAWPTRPPGHGRTG